jgi:hypothetical protein
VFTNFFFFIDFPELRIFSLQWPFKWITCSYILSQSNLQFLLIEQIQGLIQMLYLLSHFCSLIWCHNYWLMFANIKYSLDYFNLLLNNIVLIYHSTSLFFVWNTSLQFSLFSHSFDIAIHTLIDWLIDSYFDRSFMQFNSFFFFLINFLLIHKYIHIIDSNEKNLDFYFQIWRVIENFLFLLSSIYHSL